MLVAAITGALPYVTSAQASLLSLAVVYPITMVIVGPLLRLAWSNIGPGRDRLLFVWVGVWAVAVFCAACWAAAQLNDWWNRRSG